MKSPRVARPLAVVHRLGLLALALAAIGSPSFVGATVESVVRTELVRAQAPGSSRAKTVSSAPRVAGAANGVEQTERDAAVTASLDLVSEAVTWERFIGTEALSNTLRRPSGGGWNAGAVSDKVLASGDGYAEYTVPATPGYAMFGLSHGDTDGGYVDIDYALYTYPPTGLLLAYEKGAYRGTFGPYAQGDRLRVSVEDGVVTYRRNGLLLGTSAVVPTYPLLVDTSLYSAGTELLDAQMAGHLEDRVTLTSTDVLWRNRVRTAATDSTLTRETSTGWNGGASSAQEIVSGDGYTEYRVTDLGSYVMFGLGHGDTDAGYADVDYAIYTYPPTGLLLVYEGGAHRTTLGRYAVNDVLRVGVEDGVVTYSVNGVLLYSSSTPPVYPLVTDTSLYSAGATVSSAKMGGDLREIVSWTHLNGVEVVGDALTRPVAGGWTAGAISSRRIATGNGGAEYPVADMASYVMFGLSHGDTDGSYADIDHALYTYPPTGQLMVFEKGVYRGQFGAYAAGDRLKVAVEDGVVSYWKNGGLLYTSLAPPTFPLVLDVSLYAGRIEGARLTGNLSSEPIIEENVVWTNGVNVTATGNDLLKSGDAAAWDAGAVSTRGIVSTDGYVELTADVTSGYRMLGLSNGDTDRGYQDIDFAVYLYGNGVLVYEGGIPRGSFGTYSAGDRLRVAVEEGRIRYRKNGQLLYSSTVVPVFPLLVDTSIYSPGSALKGAILAGTLESVVVAQPVFSPPEGLYPGPQDLVIATSTPGTLIRYTTDASDPTEASALYAGPLSVATATDIAARAFKPGWSPSPVARAAYRFNYGTLAPPAIQPPGGTYSSAVTVALESATPQVAIRYTLDGSEPTASSTAYISPLMLVQSTTLKARAFHPDYTTSATTTGTFTIVAAAPTFSPDGGSALTAVAVAVGTTTGGATIRYTTNGNDPTVSDPAVSGGTVTVLATGLLKARAFKPGCDPSPVKSASYTIALSAGPALWLDSDWGITKDLSDRVTSWKDQSGHGNHAVQAAGAAQPLLVTDALNRHPVLRFGANQFVNFTTRLTTIRTVFWVVKDASGPAGFHFLLGDPAAQDFHSGDGGKIWWNGGSTPARAGTTRLNGVPVDGTITNRPATPSIISLVTSANGTASSFSWDRYDNARSWLGDLAELIIYDRALTGDEVRRVESYLSNKYKLYTTAGRPTASPPGGLFTGSTAVSLWSPTACSDIHYTTDGSEPTEASALYTEPFTLTQTTTLKAKAFCTDVPPSETATFGFTRDTDVNPRSLPGRQNLKLWLRADAGISGDVVDRWADQSGNGNDAIPPPNVLAVRVVSNPASAFGGLPSVRFTANQFVNFTTRLTTIRTVFWVVKDDSGPAGFHFLLGDPAAQDFHSGDGGKIWHPSNGSAVARAGTTRLNGVPVDGTITNRPATPSIISLVTSANGTASSFSWDRYDNARSWLGDLAELIIYDRALTGDEVRRVESYLSNKYKLYTTAGRPTASPPGGLFTGSTAVSLWSPTACSDIHYTTDGSEPTEASALYTEPFTLTQTTTLKAKAFCTDVPPSETATFGFTRDTDVNPRSLPGRQNLKLWLRADAGISGDVVDRWADQSGNGNDAIPPPNVLAVRVVSNPASAFGGLPSVRFTANQFVNFTTRLTTIRTVFWVVKDDSGSTGFHFLLGDPTAQDFHGGDGGKIWWNGGSTPARAGTTRLNGMRVDGTVTNRPTTPSVISLVTSSNGTASSFSWDRYDNARSWLGDLAELIIYDRALQPEEVFAVERYLDQKYFHPSADADRDGLSDELELQLGSDIHSADTNGDGIPDAVARAAGLSLTDLDMDDDGLTNVQERALGTDPFRPDTDEDGVNDGTDCFPLDATRSRCPEPVPGDSTPPVITLVEPTNATRISSVP